LGSTSLSGQIERVRCYGMVEADPGRPNSARRAPNRWPWSAELLEGD